MSGSGRGGWWTLGLVGLLIVAGGCAIFRGSFEDKGEDEVPRPEWRIGDRWVFQRSTLSGQSAVVTHQVTAATGAVYTVRVTGLAEEVRSTWTADLHLASLAASERLVRFEPAAPYFRWPLKLGQTWSETLRQLDGPSETTAVHTWHVGKAIERIDTLAGSYYCVRIEHRMGADQRVNAYWYTPRVRYWVRHEHYLGGYTEMLVETSVSSP
jgi:hypothetical protein